ncbi:MAG: histidine--tRNA ligase, partial [Elusimicrobiaceae bacterium]|nr:histidine--tRNA ligase [Elusimicrobiaceae bacterium]
MNLIAKRIRGMQDLLPDKSKNWETLEKIMKEEAEVYGFKFIRTPVLEQTELFERSVGNESDIVEKEMYTFKDKGDRSVTLRPEGTAGALRAVLENGLNNGPMPLKLMYVSSCYRYEKPQSGRYREFFQFGLEVFGAPAPLADAELICLAKSILDRLTIKNLSLEINSIGCKECRKKYNEAIINYFNKNKENLCETCQKRLEKNPMRILDCKEKGCIDISKNAP